jgi:hypothetical protein
MSRSVSTPRLTRIQSHRVLADAAERTTAFITPSPILHAVRIQQAASGVRWPSAVELAPAVRFDREPYVPTCANHPNADLASGELSNAPTADSDY